jgi:hypothetical protein
MDDYRMRARKEADEAFERALITGRLSRDENADNYVGDFMYMGKTTNGQHDAFKHRTTREYLPVTGAA